MTFVRDYSKSNPEVELSELIYVTEESGAVVGSLSMSQLLVAFAESGDQAHAAAESSLLARPSTPLAELSLLLLPLVRREGSGDDFSKRLRRYALSQVGGTHVSASHESKLCLSEFLTLYPCAPCSFCAKDPSCGHRWHGCSSIKLGFGGIRPRTYWELCDGQNLCCGVCVRVGVFVGGSLSAPRFWLLCDAFLGRGSWAIGLAGVALASSVG